MCKTFEKIYIYEKEYSNEFYPDGQDITDIRKGREFLTPLMQIFMEAIVKDDIKRNCIGQTLIQAIKQSSVMSPILFGTAVELDHVFGSKWLIEEL